MSTRATETCKEHGLAYDPSVSAGCVLCRRQSVPAAAARPAFTLPRGVPIVVVLAIAIGGAAWWARGRLSTGPGHEVPVVARTVTGRTGAAYVPGRVGDVPLLVWLHGSGEHPATVLRRLTPWADRDGFAVLVPDSVEPGGWRVGDRPDDVTADRRHVMDCVSELLARPDVHVDRSRVLVAGFSAGGSSAPAIASHEEPFTAFAILHGGVVAGSFGPRHLRGWLSTGRGDTVRSVAQVQQAAAQLRAGGATDLEIQAFDGGHVLFDPEIDAMLAWWLG